ncbi:MAG TPA: PadR family transcriptional regulator [Rhizomicrobium sp.]|jgi:DNA-binding PadR family transcriptional regulator
MRHCQPDHDHHGHHHHGGWKGFIHRRHRGGWGGGPWGEEGEGRRGRGRRVFDASELQLVLLKLLSEQPRHGYDLIRAIEDLTGGAYSPSPGVVYPTLTMLSEMGHTSEDQSEGSRKTYAVTPDGQAFLDARKTEVAALMARLAEMASERARFDNAPVRRAMMNLRAVLMHRLGEETVKPETLHAVTAIIDEAAQRIERL